MKILMLTDEFPPFPGGVATYAEQLGRAATDLGHDVTVSAPTYPGDATRGDGREYPFEVKPYPRRTGAAKYGHILARLARFSADRSFDIVHSVDLPYHLCLRRTQRLFRSPLYHTVHGTDILLARRSLTGRILGGRRPFGHAARVLANSCFTRDLFLRSNPGVPSDRVRVTPLGVDQYWFDEPSPRDLEEAVARYEIGPRQRIILTVARLTPRKGHRLLFEALSAMPVDLRENVVHLCVGIADDPAYEQELRRLAARTGTRVVFAGAVSRAELRALYERADVFCLPGQPDPLRVEGFGLVYLEAAARGLPSVACEVDAIPEVVLHESTGWLVSPEDPAALASTLARVLTSREATRDAGRQARARALEFTWRQCARLTYER